VTDQIEKFSETYLHNGVRITYQVTTFSSKYSSTKNIQVNGFLETLEGRNLFSADFVVTKETSSQHTSFYTTCARGISSYDIWVHICSCGRPYIEGKDISPESCLARSNRYVREKIGDLCD